MLRWVQVAFTSRYVAVMFVFMWLLRYVYDKATLCDGYVTFTLRFFCSTLGVEINDFQMSSKMGVCLVDLLTLLTCQFDWLVSHVDLPGLQAFLWVHFHGEYVSHEALHAKRHKQHDKWAHQQKLNRLAPPGCPASSPLHHSNSTLSKLMGWA